MSEANNLDQVQADIAKLSASERRQLLSNLDYEERQQKSVLPRDQAVVLSMLSDICHQRQNQDAFLRQYGRRKFVDKVDELLLFINNYRKMLRPAQVEGLIQTCLRCLASELAGRSIPLSYNNVLDSMNLLGHAVDRRFPGYAAAGMLHRVVG